MVNMANNIKKLCLFLIILHFLNGLILLFSCSNWTMTLIMPILTFKLTYLTFVRTCATVTVIFDNFCLYIISSGLSRNKLFCSLFVCIFWHLLMCLKLAEISCLTLDKYFYWMFVWRCDVTKNCKYHIAHSYI